MGAFLLAAGAKGKRFALPNSRVMIHQPMGGFQGQASDIEIHAREILYLRERLNELMAKHTGQDDRDHREGHRSRQLPECGRGGQVRSGGQGAREPGGSLNGLSGNGERVRRSDAMLKAWRR